MIHDPIIGHLDPAAICDSVVVALRPLDEAAVARVLASHAVSSVRQAATTSSKNLKNVEVGVSFVDEAGPSPVRADVTSASGRANS
jgi:hypothetical protein